ncbi:hypothetical protein [Amycolatopsis sp. NPDC052450]|uniref:hypothetical protein n=1 Tax=Amycolatopsis sp. NPDC052450 TaxID=3363937 RepID=UPI0037C8CC01
MYEEYSQRLTELEQLIANSPGDHTLRHEIATVLYRRATEARSVTRDHGPILATSRQRELCREAGQRILALRVNDAELDAKARELLHTVETGDRWVWRPAVPAALSAALFFLGGLGLVLLSMAYDSVLLAAAAAMLSSALLAIVILRCRRQLWRVDADRKYPLIRHHGI